MGVNLSINMNLPVPQVGNEDGPQYATDVNNCMTIIDSHSHVAGSGVQITPSAMNINSDLSFQSNNLTLARSIRFAPQSAPLALVTDLGCLYESGVDLYYNDGAGNQVRITQSGGVAGSPGSIANLTSPASASYVSGNQTFVWQSAANTPANMDGGSFIFRNIAAASNGITVSAPNALASNYTLTLPSIPGATAFVTLDSSGNFGSTIAISGGITASMIAAGTITGTQITSNVNLAGKAVQENGSNVVVSNTNATNSLAIVRGRVSGTSVVTGEGFTVTQPGTGHYSVAFTTSFGDVPAICSNAENPGAFIASYDTVTVTGVDIFIKDTSGNPSNSGFSIIAIGQRA